MWTEDSRLKTKDQGELRMSLEEPCGALFDLTNSKILGKD